MFRRKLRSRLINNKYREVEAFRLGNKSYYMFDSQFEVPTGRQMAALAVYEEMNMRCTREYLDAHIRAMDKILSAPGGKIDLKYVYILNTNLRERLDLMPLPDFIYKLSSVVFFDDSESRFNYDFEYAEKKIKIWKEAGGTLDFFLKTPLRNLIPSLTMPEENSQTYFQVAKEIDKIHHKVLTDILSVKE